MSPWRRSSVGTGVQGTAEEFRGSGESCTDGKVSLKK